MVTNNGGESRNKGTKNNGDGKERGTSYRNGEKKTISHITRDLEMTTEEM